ncbi:MAG: glycosyltransferase family 2 protein [Candidatus Melainabacteria bacterium]|nr:MAG: glycosyltransferase family 2 protein [Candidatus Melainabacteria bacterium]
MDFQDKIKVSVIVPVYNVEKYLRECLESLVNQTLKDIEIICINDGSEDSSLEILNEYASKDSRFVIINQENSGQSVARNKGFDVAKGEYIGFVDSDDWVDLNFFENLYSEAVKNNSDIAAASIRKVIYDKLDKYIIKYDSVQTETDTDKKYKLAEIPDWNYIWNKIYKTSSFRKTGLKFKEGVYFEDVILTPQVVYYLQRLTTVPNCCYYYRYNSTSTCTMLSAKKITDEIIAKKTALEFVQKNNVVKAVGGHWFHKNIFEFYLFNIKILKVLQYGIYTQYRLFNLPVFTIRRDS